MIQLEEGDEKNLVLSRFLVVGKVVANGVLNRIEVLAILQGIWSLKVAPCIWEVGDNIYRISFKFEEILRRAMDEGPWSIMGNSMVLKRWVKGRAFKEVDFSVIEFNIQVHNLPIKMLTRKNAEVIGRSEERRVGKEC